jgi:hypothetical protein
LKWIFLNFRSHYHIVAMHLYIYYLSIIYTLLVALACYAGAQDQQDDDILDPEPILPVLIERPTVVSDAIPAWPADPVPEHDNKAGQLDRIIPGMGEMPAPTLAAKAALSSEPSSASTDRHHTPTSSETTSVVSNDDNTNPKTTVADNSKVTRPYRVSSDAIDVSSGVEHTIALAWTVFMVVSALFLAVPLR